LSSKCMDTGMFKILNSLLPDVFKLVDLAFAPQDPLSALDARVGKAVFQNILQDAASGKTRILVTHALHFLPKV
jgi:hypothetical protein